MTETPFHGRVTYNAPLGKSVAAIFGLGYTYNIWGGDSLESFYGLGTTDNDAGPGALVGLRFGGSGLFSLRVDLTGDYIVNPFNETSTDNDSRFDLGMDAMLSFAFGGKPKAPKDTDKDGVPDKTPDLCPNTPVGTAVDASGCPWGDADKDGVNDNLDKCPNTPVGATVDATGCPADQDKDGVLNGIDKCPNTPVGATVDAKGCPADQDKDGVYNGIDKCPDTPAGAKVDATGCPVDSDGDGVPDYADKCPNTPAGIKVNADGCPLLFEPGKSALVLEGVTFATQQLHPRSGLDRDPGPGGQRGAVQPGRLQARSGRVHRQHRRPRAQHEAVPGARAGGARLPCEQGRAGQHAHGQGLRPGASRSTPTRRRPAARTTGGSC